MRTVWLNGDFVPETEAAVSIFDRGLNFGQSVYEVTPVIEGHYCNWPHHQARLDRSLATARIDDATDWPPILAELIARNGLKEGRIYLQVTAGATADRAFPLPEPGTTATRFAFTQADALIANPVAERGQRIVLRPDLRWQVRSAKTTQLLYAVLMKAEAKDVGVDDVWLVENGVVTEATSSNAHIIDARGVLVSHPVDFGVLPGVTRINVVAIARAMGLMVEERPFTPDELLSAREAFSSGAGTLVLPVVEVDGKPIGNGGPGAVTAEIRERYIALLRQG
ncbi:D-alanine transaminase [Novosphingobium kunmingense]|uniref:Probable branched-chain-amino-acid aminotransferase n=1 Tax=Novosphingobium kunmingense TaxID=1211806 RepID=A0A2N0I1R3_9SPHN|nr:aminotransferase class IV [Novosphingobium kunmingense]PKB25114.1 D-alanine transaminase [Novosphingobium kunmingense]